MAISLIDGNGNWKINCRRSGCGVTQKTEANI